MLRRVIDRSMKVSAASGFKSPRIVTGENSSTSPSSTTLAREPAAEDSPEIVPSSLPMPMSKFGRVVRSANRAEPLAMRIASMRTGKGIGPRPAVAGAFVTTGGAGGLASPGGDSKVGPGAAAAVAPGPARIALTLLVPSGAITTLA